MSIGSTPLRIHVKWSITSAHFDSVFAEKGIVTVSYSHYNFELVLSNFLALGHVNDALTRQQFIAPEDLLDGVHASLGEVPRSDLEYAFHH
jgi:hypothetical protein